MNPSPRAIEQAIEALKAAPATFQRLIEGYAQIAQPQLFQLLDPGGRRSDDGPRKGRPDATAAFKGRPTTLLAATQSEPWAPPGKDDGQKAGALAAGTIG